MISRGSRGTDGDELIWLSRRTPEGGIRLLEQKYQAHYVDKFREEARTQRQRYGWEGARLLRAADMIERRDWPMLARLLVSIERERWPRDWKQIIEWHRLDERVARQQHADVMALAQVLRAARPGAVL